jgi:hypothetical protein
VAFTNEQPNLIASVLLAQTHYIPAYIGIQLVLGMPLASFALFGTATNFFLIILLFDYTLLFHH